MRIIGGALLLLLCELTYVSPALAEMCNQNVPAYSQPGCTEPGQTTSSYTPPTTTTPYTPPSDTAPYTAPMTEGPEWQPANPTKEKVIATVDVLDENTPAELLPMIQSSLKEVATFPALVAKEASTLKFFGINKKKMRAAIITYQSNLRNVEKELKAGKTLSDDEMSEVLGEFDGEYFSDALTRLHDASTIARNAPLKEVRLLLVKSFKPIASMINEGDFAAAYEALDPYLQELKKNKKLYLSKKLTSGIRQKIQKNLNDIDAKIAEIVADNTEDFPEQKEGVQPKEKEAEAKKPSATTDTKKLNEAIQRSIQNDAQNRVWNLFQGRYPGSSIGY